MQELGGKKFAIQYHSPESTQMESYGRSPPVVGLGIIHRTFGHWAFPMTRQRTDSRRKSVFEWGCWGVLQFSRGTLHGQYTLKLGPGPWNKTAPAAPEAPAMAMPQELRFVTIYREMRTSLIVWCGESVTVGLALQPSTN